MNAMRRLSAAVVVAAMMSVGFGSTTLHAAKRDGDSIAAICGYLAAVMAYENVNPYIYAWAAALYQKFGCDAG